MDRRVIGSEDEAWEVLADLVQGRVLDTVALEYELGEWASFSVNIRGKKYHSSLTPRLMHGLLEYHNGLARTFALTNYGKADGRLLTREDQEALQLVFFVEGGSTGIKAKLNRSFAGEINIPPRLALMISIIAALAFCGAVGIKAYFGTVQSGQEVERDRERTEQSREETRRMELLNIALGQLHNQKIDPTLIEEIARSSILAIIKSVPDADSISISGVRLSREQMDEILANDPGADDFPRTITGSFTVRGLRNTLPRKYFLNVERGGMKIRASYDPTQLDKRTTDRIANALLVKSDLTLQILLTGRSRSQLHGVVLSFE